MFLKLIRNLQEAYKKIMPYFRKRLYLGLENQSLNSNEFSFKDSFFIHVLVEISENVKFQNMLTAIPK